MFSSLQVMEIDIHFLDNIVRDIGKGVEGNIDKHLEIGAQQGAEGFLIGLFQEVASASVPVIDKCKGQITATIGAMKGRYLEHTLDTLPASRHLAIKSCEPNHVLIGL